IVASAHAVTSHRAAHRRRTELLRAHAELAESRQHTLRLQLQPHFLFNALHAISELVYLDPKLADQSITQLGHLLRMAIAGSGRDEHALEEELRLLDAYVDVERARGGNTFHFEALVPPELRGLVVPVLILQPLTENAFRHGIRNRAHGRIW